MCSVKSWSITIFVMLCNTAWAANILAVFPAPAISHQVVFRPLTQALAKRGHNVVILTTDPAFPKNQAPENITEIDLHDLSYKVWKDKFIRAVNGKSSITVLETAYKTLDYIFEKQLNQREVQDLIKSNIKFDLIFTEALIRSALAISLAFKAPVIQISSFGAVTPNYETIGAPMHYILYPDGHRKRLYNLSIWEKIEGFFEDLSFKNIIASVEDSQNSMIKRNFGNDAPTVRELGDNVHMLFLNVNPIWEDNRAVPPCVIYMGGLHENPDKELPEDLKSYLDKSKHGVIYMSFGTNMQPSLLPPERIRIFNKIFSKLPYDVLWKWDADHMDGKADNVKLFKWLPQSDLLKHPKIKLFITQAGLQSTDEAITAGVPLIAFPLMADQWYNAEKYVHHKIGLKFLLEELKEEDLEKGIERVIKDKSYRENIVRLRSRMKDQPQTPLERAVWWTEYAIRHGGTKHLRSPAANISWWDYLVADVILVVVTAILFTLVILTCAVKLIISKVFGQKRKAKTQ